MNDLIARLGKATGPSQRLDAQIAVQAGGYTELHPASGQEHLREYISKGEHHAIIKPPAYTGSFDAARLLIPDGLYWHAGEGKTRDDEPLGAASIIAPGSLDTIAEAEHASVIIAMCIAALKAREASAQSNDDRTQANPAGGPS